jgi:hypothetical protein
MVITNKDHLTFEDALINIIEEFGINDDKDMDSNQIAEILLERLDNI